MPSAFHTFKLVAMASNNHNTSHPPSTPVNSRPIPQMNSQQHDNVTPSSDSHMNPPSVPRSLMTPVRDLRENSVMSAGMGNIRKPRQNLDERDHLLMLKHCYEQRHNFKEGTKAQFWNSVNAAFQQDTGKVLAQMSATVGRLVETRRRQISDWENGLIPQKPGGELNDSLDKWIDYLKEEDGDGEAERMRQVDARRKVEEARKEARRQAIAAEQLSAQQNPGLRGQPQLGMLVPSEIEDQSQDDDHQGEEDRQTNGETEISSFRPQKKRKRDERSMARELAAQQADWHARHLAQQQQHQQHQQQPQQQHQQLPQPQEIQHQQPPAPPPQHHLAHAPPPPQYAMSYPPEPVRRVVVEGALTKEDWRDIMGNDARLRALETKIDKIEVMVSQNNKLLLQLVQNQNQHNKDRDRERDHHENNEEDRVPVHLDAEFERDYL